MGVRVRDERAQGARWLTQPVIFATAAILCKCFATSQGAVAPNGQCIDQKGECAALAFDGGWTPDFNASLYTTRCNIPKIVLDAPLSADEFRRRFENQAVILARHPDNSRTRMLTVRNALLAVYGDRKVWLASANTFSHEKKRVTVREYVEDHMARQSLDTPANETWYLFGDDKEEVWDGIFGAFVTPEFFREADRIAGFSPTLSFGIGASGTGVPFHIHGPGFSETLWGKKRWFIMKDGKRPQFDPNETTLAWLEKEYYPMAKGEKPGFQDLLECVLEPGEYIFFPNNWYHATLNLGETVFMSTFT